MKAGSGDAHAHAHGEGAADESFPRQLLAGLVGEATDAHAARERRWVWLLAGGLALVALGLPDARLGVLRPADEPALAPLLAPVAARFAHPETGWFLCAALAYALSLPALVASITRLGFETRTALLAALAVLSAPLAWAGATTPSLVGPGLLGAACLLGALFSEPRGRSVRAALAWLFAAALHPLAWLAWPAAAIASAGGRGARALVAPVAALALAAVLGLLRLPPYAPAPAGGALGLGAAWPLLLLPFVLRRQPEESPPPRWLAVWCALALAPLALGVGTGTALAAPWLLAPAAVGFADLAARMKSEERGRVILAGITLAHVAAAAAWSTRPDPARAWREEARAVLEPGDLVLTSDPDRLYLARRRFGVEALDPTEAEAADLERAVEKARASGHRALFDETSDEGAAARPTRLEGPEVLPRPRAGDGSGDED